MNAPRILTSITEDIINRVLRMDEDSLRALGDLDGKVFCLHYVPQQPDADVITRYVLPSEGGIRLLHEYQGRVDVTISGNLPAYARFLVGDFSTEVFSAAASMQIQGNIDLGQRFQHIMGAIDIDWEEHLSRYTGDILAHKIGNMTRGLRRWQRQARRDIARDATEYLQEETTLLPWPDAVEDFLRGVDVLRADADRLEQRIRQLQGRL